MAEKDRGGGICRGSRGKWGQGPGTAEERGARVQGQQKKGKGGGEMEGDPVLKDRGVQEQRRILGGSEAEWNVGGPG